MITTTLLLSLVLLSPLDWSLIAQRAVPQPHTRQTCCFAWRGGDYFSGPLETSPYLHTWSLGVEEQFYIVWPIVVLLAVRWSRPSDRSLQRGETRVAVVMGFIAVASFTVNIVLTNQASPWAFFGLASRAWEFAVAGLVIALLHDRSFGSPGLRRVASRRWRSRSGRRRVATRRADPVPRHCRSASSCRHHAAVGGGPRTATGGDSSNPLAQPAGDALPRQVVILLVPLALAVHRSPHRRPVPRHHSLAIAGCAHCPTVAAVSYMAVENPVRFSRRLRTSRPRTYALGAAAP